MNILGIYKFCYYNESASLTCISTFVFLNDFHLVVDSQYLLL